MKKMITSLMVLISAVVLTVMAQSPQYVGSEKCKSCHMNKAKGDAYGVWKASKHCQAFATLATEQSKAVAKKLGIADAQKSAKCLKCHVTAASAPAAAREASFKQEEGVGCEVCHGPGSEYKAMRVMRALAKGTQDAKAVGFDKGDKSKCVTCHNAQSPTWKGFKPEEDYKKIAHEAK